MDSKNVHSHDNTPRGIPGGVNIMLQCGVTEDVL